MTTQPTPVDRTTRIRIEGYLALLGEHDPAVRASLTEEVFDRVAEGDPGRTCLIRASWTAVRHLRSGHERRYRQAIARHPLAFSSPLQVAGAALTGFLRRTRPAMILLSAALVVC